MNEKKSKKIVHIIVGLNSGGAEAVLYRLITSDTFNIHEVIVLTNKGFYGDKLIKFGIKLHILNASIGVESLVALYKYMENINPDIVQTWMFHANLIGGLVAKLAGIKRIFWGIHAANIKLLPVKTRFIVRLSALLSYVIPTKIICCGTQAKQVMSDNLYCKSKLSVIYNGYDTDVFSPFCNTVDRNKLVRDIHKNSCLIGFVSRWDVYKDVPNLLSALKVVVDHGIKVKCLFAGEGLNDNNSELYNLIESQGLSEYVVLLGTINDIPDLMRTIDICLLSSISEAFPNVLAESMACGTPCITTDVGDAEVIVGETGWLVPHSNHTELANAVIDAVSKMKDKQKWIQRRKESRERIVNNFSINKMVNNYVKMWGG